MRKQGACTSTAWVERARALGDSETQDSARGGVTSLATKHAHAAHKPHARRTHGTHPKAMGVIAMVVTQGGGGGQGRAQAMGARRRGRRRAQAMGAPWTAHLHVDDVEGLAERHALWPIGDTAPYGTDHRELIVPVLKIILCAEGRGACTSAPPRNHRAITEQSPRKAQRPARARRVVRTCACARRGWAPPRHSVGPWARVRDPPPAGQAAMAHGSCAALATWRPSAAPCASALRRRPTL